MTTNQFHNSTSLYVGELASDISESHLYAIFSTVGLVSSIRVCRDALTRRSLGYAYVNYHSPYDASEALERFNNQPISGKPCRIMYSQRDPSLRKSGVGNIFIKNLNKSIDHKSLFDTFSAFGNILSCKIATDENGNSKGYGFVQFDSQETADKAIEKVNSMMLMDKQVYVGKFIPKKERMKFRENQEFTNVYVKNLPDSTDEKSLTDLFKDFGTINSVAVKTHDKLKFGFVDFANPADARKAVAEMNGKQVGDLSLYVARAQKKAERQAELKYKFQHELANKYQGVNLYIKNLSEDVTDARLRQEFSQFGTITSAEVMKDEKGNSKGFGFVCFTTPEEASKAMQEMNNQMWDSKPIYVALAQRKEVRKAQLQALRQNKGTHVFSGTGPLYSGPGQSSGGPPAVYFPPQNQYNIYPSAQMIHPPRGGRGGWNAGNPQNQFQSYAPNLSRGPRHHRGQGPQGGYPSHRGGRFQHSRGGASSRGEANVPAPEFQQQNPPQQVQQEPQSQLETNELTPEALERLPKEERDRVIGEHLFPLVEKSLVSKVSAEKLQEGDIPLAGKITGMLLDNLQQGTGAPEELLHLVNNENALDAKINEALAVLEAHVSHGPTADQ